MIPFLSMLQSSNAKKPEDDSGRLGQAIGAKGASFIRPSDKSVGMQYVNAGMNAPELPNMMNMLAGTSQMTKQGGPAGKLPIFDILSMLRGGR